MERSRVTIWFLMAILAITLGGCKAKKGLIHRNSDTVNSVGAIQKVVDNQINYESLELRGSTKATLDDTRYNLTFTYRNYRDSLIWISVRAMLGIEVVRISCTPDEVAVYSRMADLNERGGWQEMEKLVGYPVDFYSLQGLMARRLFFPKESGYQKLNSFMVNRNDNGLLLVPDNDTFKEGNDGAMVFPVFLIDENSHQIKKARISPANSGWQFEVDYGDEVMDDQFGFPKNYLIVAMDAKQKIELNLKWQGVKMNEELKTPYQW